MPRIPVRTTPYHTPARCTRHYKSKRDLILRALGKASFINGSQFVIAWISPKGDLDVYASEMLQNGVNGKDASAPSVLCRQELEREAKRIKVEMTKRWDDIRRLEEKGEAPVMEEDGNDNEEGGADMEDGEDVVGESIDTKGAVADFDPDVTLVDEPELDLKMFSAELGAGAGPSSMKKSFSTPMIQSTSGTTMIPSSSFAPTVTRASTPGPQLHAITLTPETADQYYSARFAALQQATCKLVVKNWIKVIEPKKQMKFPYNKGEEMRPSWWPADVRHREPDHLSKQERLTLLTAIVRSSLISVSRLELSTAEAGAFISQPRQGILRELYLVAKEEERKRKDNDTSPEITVHLPHAPVSPSAITPECGEKRPQPTLEVTVDGGKENVFQAGPATASSSQSQMLGVSAAYGMTGQQPQKRMRTSNNRLPTMAVSQAYDATYTHPFTFAPQNLNIPMGSTQQQQQQHSAWRDGLSAPPPHLSPYPQDIWAASAASTEYARSPLPDFDPQSSAGATGSASASASVQPKYATHLAPILTSTSMGGTPSPLDSPAYASATSVSASQGYFPRTHTHTGHSYMQQQQMEYLQHHQQQQASYDYASPYLADWEPTYTST